MKRHEVQNAISVLYMRDADGKSLVLVHSPIEEPENVVSHYEIEQKPIAVRMNVISHWSPSCQVCELIDEQAGITQQPQSMISHFTLQNIISHYGVNGRMPQASVEPENVVSH